MAGSGRKVWAADEVLEAADLQDYIQDQVVFVYNDSSTRAAGILSPTEGMVSYLKDTNLLYAFDGSSWVEIAPNVGTPGTYTKVTTDAKGRVTSGTTLSAGDIPSLDASKITTGSFNAARIPSLDASKITTGSFDAARIPSLDASKITTGVFPAAFIPSLDASKITAGTLTRPLNTTTVETTGNITSGGQVYGASMLTPTISGGADWNIADDGGGRFNAGLQSSGVYNTSLSGPYRTVWVNSSGTIGYTSSTITKKQDVVDAKLSADIVSQLRPVTFKYKDDVAEFGDDAETQIGLIAEDLLDIPGMEKFVFYDDVDGEKIPAGIHYELLAVALIPAIQKQAAQIELLEARLSKLEK